MAILLLVCASVQSDQIVVICIIHCTFYESKKNLKFINKNSNATRI